MKIRFNDILNHLKLILNFMANETVIGTQNDLCKFVHNRKRL